MHPCFPEQPGRDQDRAVYPRVSLTSPSPFFGDCDFFVLANVSYGMAVMQRRLVRGAPCLRGSLSTCSLAEGCLYSLQRCFPHSCPPISFEYGQRMKISRLWNWTMEERPSPSKHAKAWLSLRLRLTASALRLRPQPLCLYNRW